MKRQRYHLRYTTLLLIGAAGVSLSAASQALAEQHPALNPPVIHGPTPRLVTPAIEPRVPNTEWVYHKTADGFHPDGEEQALLWLMNRARQNPPAEGQWLATTSEPDVAGGRDYFGVNTTLLQSEFAAIPAKPPGAFDRRLYEAAYGHSLDLIARDAQDHTGQLPKVDAVFSWLSYRGNVFSYADNALNGHAAFNIDWGPDVPADTDGMQDGRGHRKAIMSIDGDYTNVGFAMVPETDTGTDIGPLVNTGNFVSANTNVSDHYNVFIVGTVWEDLNSNDRYDPGEGIANITVTPAQGTYYAVTGDAGGYAIPVVGMSAGSVSVSFTGSGVSSSKNVTVSTTASVLLDLVVVAEEPNPDLLHEDGFEN